MGLSGIFSFFANNPIAQGIAAGLAFLFVWKANNWHQRSEGRRDIKNKMKEKAHEAEKRVLEERTRTADLNESERLRLAREHPNNRGRVQLPDRP